MRRTVTLRLRRAALGSLILVLGLPMTAAPASSAAPKPQVLRPAAVTTGVRLDVFSARDSSLRSPRGTDDCAPFAGMHLVNPGQPVGCGSALPTFHYKWMINADNTGDPHQPSPVSGPIDPCHPVTSNNLNGDPLFPANCNWPSIHPVLSSPVLTQGDETNWNRNSALDLSALQALNPGGKYLVSVSADGFEIGGAHFTLPLTIGADGNATVSVGLNPYPIPLGTIQVKVFNDMAPADGMFDVATELPLEGFSATVNDILGQVSTDWYVNPICTEYERTVPAGQPGAGASMGPATALLTLGVAYEDFLTWAVTMNGGAPIRVPGTGGKCLSDANGIVRIPNMGTNRYSIKVTPPGDAANQGRWAQTTTLEGGHDWDFWMMANDSGLDTELVQAGEPVPWAQFGFADVKKAPSVLTGSGHIKGTVMAASPYVPGRGGLVGQGGANGQSGLRYSHPMDRVWIALNDLENNGDQLGYTTLVNADGTFDISGVRDGTYQMGVWDVDQDYAFDSFNVTVLGGRTVDLGNVPLLGWFTRVTGNVFVDTNANGKRDPGEQGVPNFDVTIKNRTNDLFVSGQNVATSDYSGAYHIKEGYPTGAFTIVEFFNTRYKTTGVTYQADNDPLEHTTLTGAVDISINPIIGQNGRIDIGVLPYDGSAGSVDNGGIVATVAYDATRNELQARKAATEDYEPGIPNIPVEIWAPVPCGAGDTCDRSGKYRLAGDGSFARRNVNVGDGSTAADEVAPGNTADPISATYITETWRRPAGCVPRDSNGNIVVQDAIKTSTNPADRTDQDCVEATMLGTTFGFADGAVGAADGQSVDGNYGFVTYKPGDYIVGVPNVPTDPIFHKPLYKVRTEDPINVFTGDVYVPQGADVSGLRFSDFLKANRYDGTTQIPAVGLREPAITSAPYPNATCVGPTHISVNTDPGSATYNPDLMNVGGSPYEGLPVAGCDYKLIHVEAGQSVAPNFNLYTDVPIPAKYYGYVTDDVSVSTNVRSTALGEVQGVGDIPVGIYDWANRLLTVTDTDPNGLFELLMPSTNSYNCPVPAGPCAGMYRFVGNDPGQYSHPNMNYQPAYRTIAANFQAWPGIFTAADTAPTRTTVQIEGPASQFSATAVCKAEKTEPQLFRISKPFVRQADYSRTFNGVSPRGNNGGVTTTAAPSKLASSSSSTFFTASDVGKTVTFGAPNAGIVSSGTTILSLAAQHGGNGSTNTSAGITTLTAPAASALTFTSVDVGSIVTSAGPGADLPNNTTIATFIDSKHVTLRNAAALGNLSSRAFTVRQSVTLSNATSPAANRTGVSFTLGGLGGGVLSGSHNFSVVQTAAVPWAFTNADIGKTLTAPGLTSGRTITSVTDATHVVFSGAGATATGSNLTFGVSSTTTQLTIKGLGFGDTAGAVLLERIAPQTGTIALGTVAPGGWTDTQITLNVPSSILSSAAPYHLVIRTAAGLEALNTVTFDVIGNGYNPTVYEVGPGKTFQPDAAVDVNGTPVFAFPGAIQRGIEAAANGSSQALVVVYPNDPADGGQLNLFSPNGAYYENLILHSPVKLQGVGPGGMYLDANGNVQNVIGSVVDGRYFWSNTTSSVTTTDTNPGNELYSFQWAQLFLALQNEGFGGNQAEAEGAVILALGGGAPIGVADTQPTDWTANVTVRNYTTGFKGAVDGFTITGGDQKAFPGTRNEAGGGANTTSEGPYIEVAGGGIFLNGYNRFMQITNNQVISNSGTFGGAVRVGSPQIGSNHNDSVRVAFNRIVANGGTNLAGAIGVYNGADNGRIDHNQICGNFTSEYGGAISHYGLSLNSEIDNNRIYLNESVDEGGAIMVAGEIPRDPNTNLAQTNVLPQGAGDVRIHHNYIGANLGGDDGGGVRFLMAGNWPMDVYDNMITNNVSTHEGGGIALDDAPNVRIYNNTIAKNITTATAVTSNGQPAPAGISTAANSNLLQACTLAPANTHSGTNGRTTNNGTTLRVLGSNTFKFQPSDVGATVIAQHVPPGTAVVSVASDGNSVVLSNPTTSSGNGNAAYNISFSLYRGCNGQPPQSASPSPFSNPLVFNNIFSDNRAGTWVGFGADYGVHGIGVADANLWDVGVADGTGVIRVSNSLINQNNGLHQFDSPAPANGNVTGDPLFTAPFDLGLSISPWRVQPRFRPTAIVGISLPDNAIGDYRIGGGSPAVNMGTAGTGGVAAPISDIENQPRPMGGRYDAGADEVIGSVSPATAMLDSFGGPAFAPGSTPAGPTAFFGAGAIQNPNWVGAGRSAQAAAERIRLVNMMGALVVATQPASSPPLSPTTTPSNVPIQMLWSPGGGGASGAFLAGTAFGSATQGQEAWVNLRTMPTLSGGMPSGGWPVLSLLLRVQGTQGNPGAHLRVTYDRHAQTITVVNSFPGGGTTVFTGVTLNNGDSLVARSLPGNVLQVLAVSTTSVTLLGTATTPGSDVAGAIGLATDGNFGLTPTPSRSFTLDAFGGGTLL